jgi:hypothetical protein
VIALIGTIIAMFGVQLFLSRPEYGPALRNLFIPSTSIITNPDHALHRHRHAGSKHVLSAAEMQACDRATTSGSGCRRLS